MFKNAHIKNVNADEIELAEKISEIYFRKVTQIKNTSILEYINDKQVAELLELKTYFSNKNQTIIVTINGL
jgi:hypothetical protein